MRCSADHTWVNGSILLDIPWAIITGIVFGEGPAGSIQTSYFPSMEDTFYFSRAGSRLIEVSVCVKDDSCSLCASDVFEETSIGVTPGLPPTKGMHCEQEWQGNQIRLTQLNNLAHFTQPCSLHVYGKCKS